MKNVILSVVFILLCTVISAQGVKISTNPGTPDASAILEMQSVSQGLLPPRMTTAQRDAIPNPADGLQIFNTTTNCQEFCIGSVWQPMACGCATAPATPGSGSHISSLNQIVWDWNVVPTASGYKWNTSNNYNTAIDLSTETSYTQTGLNASTPYTLYVWAYNACGVSNTPATLTTNTLSPPCVVGGIGPAGGRVFYCGNAYNGYMGLEAAPSDQSNGATWGCAASVLSGSDGITIGTGNQNTTDIVNGCGESGIAARLCSNLSLNGYDDWFLPSQDELILMYTNLHTVNLGSFTSNGYWSSTEIDAQNYAWAIFFQNGSSSYDVKNGSWRVRAIRRFNY